MTLSEYTPRCGLWHLGRGDGAWGVLGGSSRSQSPQPSRLTLRPHPDLFGTQVALTRHCHLTLVSSLPGNGANSPRPTFPPLSARIPKAASGQREEGSSSRQISRSGCTQLLLRRGLSGWDRGRGKGVYWRRRHWPDGPGGSVLEEGRQLSC